MKSLRLLPIAALVVLTSCDRLPGRPDAAAEFSRPRDVKDFATLYATHCSGCHGEDGRLGAARPLNDPVYLAVVNDRTLARVIRRGVRGTAMPAFGGTRGLSDEQITSLTEGMRSRWGEAGVLGSTVAPHYSTAEAEAAGVVAGTPTRGEDVYRRACRKCHGDHSAGSIVDPSYLALVSDQALRSAVIFGRIDLGMADWRGERVASGRAPLTERDIADLVAWLVSRRTEFPGSPYPVSTEENPS
jgi:mono/diheme cytochrome c family protein